MMAMTVFMDTRWLGHLQFEVKEMAPFSWLVKTRQMQFAGDDLSIVIARITTCGEWSFNLNLASDY